MSENNPSMGPDFDDLPDLSTPEWRGKFDAARVRRGRPKSITTKVSTTIRLDRDVVDAFRSTGPGWQGRINETLVRAARRLKRTG